MEGKIERPTEATAGRKPRVMMVLHLPPPIHGASNVGKQIRDSKAVNEAFDCCYHNLSTAKSLEDISKFRFGKLLDVRHLISTLKEEAGKFSPDIVYLTPCSTGLPFYKDYLVARALKKAGYKLVYHFHNKGVMKRAGRFPDNILYRKFFKDAKVMLLSERLYDDISKYVDRDNVLICPNGVDFEVSDLGSVTESNHPVNILFLSNLLKSKGPLILLDALSLLDKQGVDFCATFAGAPTSEISEDEIKQKIAEHGLETKVKYIGAVYGENKARVFKNADIFVFPTTNECFPIVLLEAMASGVPCLTSREGGIPDIVEDGVTGYTLEYLSPENIAEALKTLIENPRLRIEMGEKGRERYSSRYTLGHFEQNFIKALKSCV